MYCSLQRIVCCWLLSEKLRLISNSVLGGTPARRHSQNRKLTPVTLLTPALKLTSALDTATTVFGEISKYVWNFVRNRWVRKIVTETSQCMTSNTYAEETQCKNWYNHQHNTIVITAFLQCHNTQEKDTQFLNVLCVHTRHSKKFYILLFLMTQAWMSSCLIPPLVRNSVVRTL